MIFYNKNKEKLIFACGDGDTAEAKRLLSTWLNVNVTDMGILLLLKPNWGCQVAIDVPESKRKTKKNCLEIWLIYSRNTTTQQHCSSHNIKVYIFIFCILWLSVLFKKKYRNSKKILKLWNKPSNKNTKKIRNHTKISTKSG